MPTYRSTRSAGCTLTGNDCGARAALVFSKTAEIPDARSVYGSEMAP